MARRLLTDEEIRRYHEDGYLRVGRPLAGPDDIAEATEILDRLFARFSTLSSSHRHDLGDDDRHALPEIVWPSAVDAGLRRTKVARVIRQVGEELLGTSRSVWHFDHAIFKPAHTGAETAWHQDVVFDPTHDQPMATVWFALVDATVENGCMAFVPQSHVGPIHPHVPNGSDGMRLADTIGPVMVCPVPAGGVTVHNARTIHGAGPNTSDVTRRAWIVKIIPDQRPWPVHVLSKARPYQYVAERRRIARLDAENSEPSR